MQQTKLDRWLREKYAYITHVYCNTRPSSIPNQVESEELDVEAGIPFRYRLSSIHYPAITELVTQLESENITYTSRVADRECWHKRWINNPKKSFSYRVFWIAVVFTGIVFALSPAPRALWHYVNEDAGESSDPKAQPGTDQKPSIEERFAERRKRINPFSQ